jgi:hypothetical protein
MTNRKTIDKDDADGLLGYIDGHVLHAREALQAGDAAKLREQAEEIEGWAGSLARVAQAAEPRRGRRRAKPAAIGGVTVVHVGGAGLALVPLATWNRIKEALGDEGNASKTARTSAGRGGR